jgi:hypothetical protein
MTPRSLFSILLKILGIFFIKDFLVAVPQLIPVIIYLTKSGLVAEAVGALVTMLVVLVIYALISYFLVLKTGYIIDKMLLDKGFDQQTISLDIRYTTVVSIAIIIIGGLMVADEIPNYCRLLFSYVQERRSTMVYGQRIPATGSISQTTGYIIVSGIKIVIGLLLMSGQKKIVKWLDRKGQI